MGSLMQSYTANALKDAVLMKYGVFCFSIKLIRITCAMVTAQVGIDTAFQVHV